MASKFIKTAITPLANLEELHYHDQFQLKEEKFSSLEAWLKRTHDGRVQRLQHAATRANFQGKVLDLGAGHCWLSAELSKLPQVREVFALEISEALLKEVAPGIFRALGALEQKITRVQGDFYHLEFPTESFDFVVASAALHHAASLQAVLQEVHRVLKPGAMLVSMRDPIIPGIPVLATIAKRQDLTAHAHSQSAVYLPTLKGWLREFRESGFPRTCYEIVPGGVPCRGWKGRMQLALHRSPMLRKIVYPWVLHSACIFYAEKP